MNDIAPIGIPTVDAVGKVGFGVHHEVPASSGKLQAPQKISQEIEQKLAPGARLRADARGCNGDLPQELAARNVAQAAVPAAPRRHSYCTGDARGPDHGKEVRFSMAGAEATSFGGCKERPG